MKTLEEKRAYFKAYRENNRDKIRENARKYARSDKGRKSNKQWYLNNPEKVNSKKYRDMVKARGILNRAILTDEIKREPCQECGEVRSEAHHRDYSKPLEVLWLCSVHHNATHKEIK